MPARLRGRLVGPVGDHDRGQVAHRHVHAGVDVGGLTPAKARALLERKARAHENTPVEFRAAGHTWRLSAEQLGVRADWAAAVDAVRHQGEGFGPVRGFRRLDLRFFGADVAPRTQVEDAALRYVLRQIAETATVIEATVRTQVTAILVKLGVGSPLAAVSMARRPPIRSASACTTSSPIVVANRKTHWPPLRVSVPTRRPRCTTCRRSGTGARVTGPPPPLPSAARIRHSIWASGSAPPRPCASRAARIRGNAASSASRDSITRRARRTDNLRGSASRSTISAGKRASRR